jgi:uncharacterized protein YdhG (YjbR/CyaY superfamily)
MPELSPKNKAVSDFLGRYPSKVRKLLEKIRTTIRRAAPEAQEVISYMMPAYKQNGILVYFSGFKDHISFFPTSSGIKTFKKELGPHAVSKGTARFDLDEPIPYGLIGRIVKYRLKENLGKVKAGKP